MACEQFGLPWHIVSLLDERWCSIKPSGYEAPLVGREWVWGVSDCWTLVRDWYRQTLGIKLRDWQRPASSELFRQSPMFEDCFADTGFVETDFAEPKKRGSFIYAPRWLSRLEPRCGLHRGGQNAAPAARQAVV